MKLLNYTTTYFAIILIIIIPIWAGIFYYAMLDEVYDSMDDGLDNQRLLIISKADTDSTVLNHRSFEEGNYVVAPISKEATAPRRLPLCSVRFNPVAASVPVSVTHELLLGP